MSTFFVQVSEKDEKNLPSPLCNRSVWLFQILKKSSKKGFWKFSKFNVNLFEMQSKLKHVNGEMTNKKFVLLISKFLDVSGRKNIEN